MSSSPSTRRDPPILEVQRTVGRFEILKEIGRGGMAVVYLARQTDLGRRVALKELGAFHASEPTFAERFVRESRVVGSLNHPNVVTVYEYFEHDGTPYISMEYVDRGSLRPWIGQLSIAQVAGIFEGVLAGLAHAAKRGIIHRDLKPENLMVTAEGTIKIADFGIAKALNQATVGRFLTATGTTVGTPTYMAPEQAMGKDVGPWTDLYSVGVMAYEMLVGRVPFHDVDTPMAILMRHVNEPIPAARSVRPDLDPGLAAWIERLLAKSPDDRTESAHQAWDELEEIVIGMLGPRWRREARLLDPVTASAATGEQPLTPAPFDESDDGFQTFQPRPEAKARSTAEPDPGQAAPPPPPAPPVPLEPANADPQSQSRSAGVGPGAPAESPSAVEETVAPERRVPAGVTSFAWLFPERGRRSGKARRLALAAAIGMASVLLAGLAVLALEDEAGPQPPPPIVTVTTETEPEPPPPPPPPPPRLGPRAQSTSVKETAASVVATIRFSRARLGPKSLAVRDADLADGSASVLIARRGLESVIGANELAGLAFRPVRAENRLTIKLSAAAGRFTSVDARPDAARKAVAIIATKTPPPPPAPRPDPAPEPRPDPVPAVPPDPAPQPRPDPRPDPVCLDKLGRRTPC